MFNTLKAALVGKRKSAASATKSKKRLPKAKIHVGDDGTNYVMYGKSRICIAVSPDAVSEQLRDQVAAGRYEIHESQMAAKILKANDIVLELGAGLGLISTVLSQTGKAREVHSYEADERLLPLIRTTHRLNSVSNATVYNQVITSDVAALAKGSMTFHLRANFWGNSTNALAGANVVRSVEVPTRSLQSIVNDIHPTVIVADIEGAELGLFTGVGLAGVHTVLLEVHPRIIGGKGMRSVFDDLHKAGFYYDPRISVGKVPGFSRV